jgi:hypothetical protein
VAGLWIVPAGITGSDALFPVGDVRVQPASIVLRLGQPIDADALLAAADAERRLVTDAIGLSIASLLPPEQRGEYASDVDLGAAARVLRMARNG